MIMMRPDDHDDEWDTISAHCHRCSSNVLLWCARGREGENVPLSDASKQRLIRHVCVLCSNQWEQHTHPAYTRDMCVCVNEYKINKRMARDWCIIMTYSDMFSIGFGFVELSSSTYAPTLLYLRKTKFKCRSFHLAWKGRKNPLRNHFI